MTVKDFLDFSKNLKILLSVLKSRILAFIHIITDTKLTQNNIFKCNISVNIDLAYLRIPGQSWLPVSYIRQLSLHRPRQLKTAAMLYRISV